MTITTKFQNKYRIPSNRMPKWNYGGDGYYFITIVTKNRICCLGTIENGTMTLSDYGYIVETELHRSYNVRTELILDEWIIMPNHIHAIVIIKNHCTNTTNSNDTSKRKKNPTLQDPLSNIITPTRLPKSLSSFISGFKSSVNSKIDDYIDKHNLATPKFNRKNHFFQPNYHDRIIRNETEYQRISRYIKNNPLNWKPTQ